MKQADLEALYSQRTLERDNAVTELRQALALVEGWESRIVDPDGALTRHLRAALKALGDVREKLRSEIAAAAGQTHLLDLWPEPTIDEPDFETLEEWFMDSMCDATDGCIVEHDGVCPHGYPSWFLYLGLI